MMKTNFHTQIHSILVFGDASRSGHINGDQLKYLFFKPFELSPILYIATLLIERSLINNKMHSLSCSFRPHAGSSINVSSVTHDQYAKPSHTINISAANSSLPRLPNKKSLLTIIFKSFDKFVSNFLDLPLTPSSNPTRILSGNFAPVNELPPTACEVAEGSLPTCLDGAYIRNGPNPHYTPRGPYHLFDGDGMLHSLRISGGKAKLCSRYVKTYKYIQEGDKGYAFFESPFSSFNGQLATIVRCALAVAKVISGYYNPVLQGFGTANTSVAFFCGSIFALCESDLPYQIRVTSDGDVITLSRRDFGARMTAHPKTDSVTGEVFAFRCDIFSPFLTFFKIDSEGIKGEDLGIFSIKRTPCIHDFALTERFIVFQDIQIEVRPMEMIMKGRTPVVYDHRKTPRIGVLRRDAEDDTRLMWIDAPGLNMLHLINAWEEDCGDKLVIVAPNFVSIDCGFNSVNLIYSIIEKITVNVKEKKLVSRHQLCNVNMEFGVINRAYTGKKNRCVVSFHSISNTFSLRKCF